MRDCKDHEKDLAAFLSGELDVHMREQIGKHLKSCSRCRDELLRLERVFKGADSLRPDIAKAMASVDWETLPGKIADSVFDEKHFPAPLSRFKDFFNFLLQSRMRPVYAALLVGLFLGSVLTFLIVRTPLSDKAPREGFFVTHDFLDRVEVEMARRETLDYLEKSQYVLLDFVQASPTKTVGMWHRSMAFQRARDLLTKKKYINPQLGKFHMAKAKEICDQIELFFFELTLLSDHLTEEDMVKIQNLIEKKQLLLKINLLKRELEESEV